MGGSKKLKIFVNEHLTVRTAILLKYAKTELKKDLFQDNRYRIDTRNCTVVVRQGNVGRWIRVKAKEDVNKLVRSHRSV